ncbi:MAG: RNA polymerase sigma factor region1.1 domain-containing protein, partial [Pseudomonadota bacterium]|nr:RNA polymerase sigma factor region1.1 domain-containing protein [Pseudomonadota bacterium]
MATKSKTKDDGDAPLIDLNEASIKKLITKAKRKGYVTYDELNDALPQGEMSSDQIEDIQSALSDMGVQIVESDEEAEAAAEEAEEVEEIAGAKKDTKAAAKPAAKKTATGERTDDPVRMYLREMGAVELLSREGEIAIAKRIEAGRDMMIMGLCQSPITFHAIIQWSEALNAEEMQLREILDLDAMLSKEPPPEKMAEEEEDDDGEISEETAGPTIRDDDEDDSDEDGEEGEEGSSKSDDEEEEDNTMSLAQMEAALKPDAIERFARITDLFG